MTNQDWKEKSHYSCRFHPTDGFHEVGCPHQGWTKEQLQEQLDNKVIEIKHLISELNKVREEEREKIFSYLVKSDMTEFCAHASEESKRYFYDGTNSMLTMFQRYIEKNKPTPAHSQEEK